MALLEDDDAAVMLEAVGDLAQIGAEQIFVAFNDTEMVADLQGEHMERTDPFCVIAKADVVRLEIHGDPNGTVLTITGDNYRVMSVDHDGPVFDILYLENI